MSEYEIGNELIRSDHLPDNTLNFFICHTFIKYYTHTIISKAVGSTATTVTRFSNNLRSVVT